MRPDFFDPLWRRIVLVAAVAIWSAFEWASGEAFWGMLTGAAALYALWTYLIAYQRSS